MTRGRSLDNHGLIIIIADPIAIAWMIRLKARLPDLIFPPITGNLTRFLLNGI